VGLFDWLKRSPAPPVDTTARCLWKTTRRQTDPSPPSDEPTNPELERAIAERPDDAEAYSVLADWLHDRHPRGELIALQLRAETDPELLPEVERYLETHADVLLGPLARYQTGGDGRDRTRVVWRRGFIDRFVLAPDAREDARHATCVEILELVLGHPSARLLRAIDVGYDETVRGPSIEGVVALLAQQPPRHLREVLLGDFDRDLLDASWGMIGNIAPIWTIPNLRRLVVHGFGFELGAISHAQLEHLEIQACNLSFEDATALATARLPALRHLDIWYADPTSGTVAEVGPLLRREDLSQLGHLGLKNARFSDELGAVLAGAPLCRQLRSFDLSLGTLSDAALPTLRTAARAFERLEKLDVSKTFLTEDGLAELARIFPRVTIIANALRESDGEGHYPVLGE
jgi:uncharacterized protein (TIGR02996 family)